MAKLIFLLDGNAIKEFVLDRERMTIGRRPNCDIHIDNLAISGEHAVIVTTDQEVFIQDMNSTNGTLVNQKTVTKHALSHGDTIGLGKYSLKFVKDDHAGVMSSDGFADTVMVTSANEQTQESTVAEATQVSESLDVPAAEEMSQVEVTPANDGQDTLDTGESEQDLPSLPPRLNILNGDHEGSELMLDKSMVKLGEPDQQVAVITKRQDGYYITHVSGDHYPTINDASIGAQAKQLSNHDVIDVLGVKMEVRLD